MKTLYRCGMRSFSNLDSPSIKRARGESGLFFGGELTDIQILKGAAILPVCPVNHAAHEAVHYTRTLAGV